MCDEVEKLNMIRHIVFFSVKPSIDVDTVEQNLRKLGQIRHSSHFEVGRNRKVDPLCDRIDLVVYAEFRDEHALAAYKADPLYSETTQKVRPLRELRFSADYPVPID
jgi:hypothetical protein